MKCAAKTSFVVYLTVALVACGQKGPLVLPDTVKRKHTTPISPTPVNQNDTGAAAPAAVSPQP